MLILLYGRPFGVVRLTRQTNSNAIPSDTLVAGIFNYKTSTHEIIDAKRDPAGFLRAFMSAGSTGTI